LKSFTAIIISAVILLTGIIPAIAADGTISDEAGLCVDIGIIRGGDNGADAEYFKSNPTRVQSALWLLRFMGVGDIAEFYDYSGKPTFNDAFTFTGGNYGYSVMAYLKEHPEYGYVGDMGMFYPNNIVTAQEFYKVLLTVLGYKEGHDFEWDQVIGYAGAKGLKRIARTEKMTNNDIAIAIYEALGLEVKDVGKTLAQKMVDDKIFTGNAVAALEKADFLKPAVTIASITNPEDISIKVGEAVTLPSKVKATYSDGSTKEVDVVWDTTSIDNATVGVNILIGTVAGTDLKASLKIIVLPAIKSIISPQDINVQVGQEIKLPTKVLVVYSDDTQGEADVVWDKQTVDNTVAGVTILTGTVTGTELKASLKVTVAALPLDFTVSASNLKEVAVTFNQPVNTGELSNKNNYTVKIAGADKTILKVTASNDGKMATLLLTNAFAQQSTLDVTVKAKLGLAADTTKTISNVVDGTIPTVMGAEALGNKAVKITFSEPVFNADLLAHYRIDGAYFSANSLPVVDGREVTIALTNRLPAGKHKITVSSDVMDFCGYRLLATRNEAEFTVADDKTPPTVELISATQTELVVRFSEPVESINGKVSTAVSTVINGIKTESDLRTNTIYFDRRAALPQLGTEVTFWGVTDFSGNQATLKLMVVPLVDTQAPVYKGHTVEEQKKIIIEYSEDVLTGGTYTLTDSTGGNVSLLAPAWYTTAGGEQVKNKIVLQRSTGQEFTPGNYTLLIKDVADNTPKENLIVPQTINIRVEDQSRPTVRSVRASGQKLFISFSEKVDPVSAINLSNYGYIDNFVYKPLPNGSIVELLAGNEAVVVTFPEGFTMSVIDALQVSNISDPAGNKMEPVGIPAPFATVGEAPRITAVEVTGRNTVALTISSEINPQTLNRNDFIVKAGAFTLTVLNAVCESNNSKVILTTNENMSTDGKYNGQAVTVQTPDALLITTQNIYGQKLQPLAATIATDKYAPYATGLSVSLSGGTNTSVVIYLSENIRTHNGSGSALTADNTELNQFIVLVDNVSQGIISSRYDDASGNEPAKITLTISGNYTSRNVKVKFYPSSSNRLTDYAPVPNSLSVIELSYP